MAICSFVTLVAEDKEIHKKLEERNDERMEKKFKCLSQIRLKNSEDIGSEGGVKPGTIFFEVVTAEPRIVKESDTKFKIDAAQRKKTLYSEFWVTKDGHIFIRNSDHITDLIRILQIISPIKRVEFDIDAISKKYDDHWCGGFRERRGNVSRGTIYGDGIEKDGIFGTEYTKCKKAQVGITTRYFSTNPTKIKVTKSGAVIIYDNVEKMADKVVGYITGELGKYMIL